MENFAGLLDRLTRRVQNSLPDQKLSADHVEKTWRSTTAPGREIQTGAVQALGKRTPSQVKDQNQPRAKARPGGESSQLSYEKAVQLHSRHKGSGDTRFDLASLVKPELPTQATAAKAQMRQQKRSPETRSKVLHDVPPPVAVQPQRPPVNQSVRPSQHIPGQGSVSRSAEKPTERHLPSQIHTKDRPAERRIFAELARIRESSEPPSQPALPQNALNSASPDLRVSPSLRTGSIKGVQSKPRRGRNKGSIQSGETHRVLPAVATGAVAAVQSAPSGGPIHRKKGRAIRGKTHSPAAQSASPAAHEPSSDALSIGSSARRPEKARERLELQVNHPQLEYRRTIISVRLNEEEFTRLRQRAEESGITVSAYMRSCVLDAEQLRAQVKQAIAEMRSFSRPSETTPLPSDFDQQGDSLWRKFVTRATIFFLGAWHPAAQRSETRKSLQSPGVG